MSNEITRPANLNVASVEEALGMMKFYAEEKKDDAEARAAANVSEGTLVPRIKISKDTTDLTIKVGDTTAMTQKFLYVVFFDVYAMRSLWAPKAKEDDYKLPICSHGYTEPQTFDAANDRGQGQWIMNPDFAAPIDIDPNIQFRIGDRVCIACKSCPYNKFESASSWDSSKGESKAKACGESRALFGLLVTKIQGGQIPTNDGTELFFYREDARIAHPTIGPMVELDLGMGSNRKAVQHMVSAAQARGVPFKACVWKLAVKHSEGTNKFAILTPEFAGLAHQITFQDVIKPQQIKVAEFVKRNSTALVSDKDVGF
jgi:hypothetical protein